MRDDVKLIYLYLRTGVEVFGASFIGVLAKSTENVVTTLASLFVVIIVCLFNSSLLSLLVRFASWFRTDTTRLAWSLSNLEIIIKPQFNEKIINYRYIPCDEPICLILIIPFDFFRHVFRLSQQTSLLLDVEFREACLESPLK